MSKCHFRIELTDEGKVLCDIQGNGSDIINSLASALAQDEDIVDMFVSAAMLVVAHDDLDKGAECSVKKLLDEFNKTRN